MTRHPKRYLLAFKSLEKERGKIPSKFFQTTLTLALGFKVPQRFKINFEKDVIFDYGYTKFEQCVYKLKFLSKPN